MGAPNFWTVHFYEKWITHSFSAQWDESNGVLKKKNYKKVTLKDQCGIYATDLQTQKSQTQTNFFPKFFN